MRVIRTVAVAALSMVLSSVPAEAQDAIRTWCLNPVTGHCFSLLEFEFAVSAQGASDEVWDVHITGEWFGDGFPLPRDSWMFLALTLDTTDRGPRWWTFPGFFGGRVPAAGGVIAQDETFRPGDYRWIGGIESIPTVDEFEMLYLRARRGEGRNSTCVMDGPVLRGRIPECFEPFDPTVVPEPGSLILLGTGLVGVAFVARRRRAAAE